MILVYFSGLGEWFIRDGNSVKLAVTRTIKEPYRDPRQHKRIETYCPDYYEWLGLDEDNEENFAEWARLYESARNTENTLPDDLYDFDSKDYKYDHKLGGIFVRDPNVEGDVFNTNGLRCWGANYVNCGEINGVFKLNPDDEKHFRLTNKDPKNDWDEFKKLIKKLLPCSHPDSAFTKTVNEGKLSNIDAERVYFEIQDQQHFDLWGKSTPIEHQNILGFVSIDGLDDTATIIPNKLIPINKKDGMLDGRRETTYQNITAALLTCITGELTGIKHPSFATKKQLIDVINKHYKGPYDLSESRLYDYVVVKPDDNYIEVKDSRSEEVYQNLIGVLLDCITGKWPDADKHPSHKGQTHFIGLIAEAYKDNGYGLSESNLSRKFPEALRSILMR
jgi:hypothetical protein